MSQQTITCPKCGHTFEPTDAFAHQVEEKLRTEYENRIAAERTTVANTTRQEIEQRVSLELSDLRSQNQEKERKLREAQVNELELRKRQREIEEREKNLQLEVQRTLDEERKKVWNEAAAKVTDDHRMKDAEKDKQLSDMKRQIEDLRLKAEQGSQQMQGEVLELELENILRNTFRTDDIQPVPKGVHGADIVQHVKTQLGNDCGSIVWEVKRTKAWSDGWIQKLKDDQRDVKATVAVIVSVVLPKDITHIGNVEGVWVVDFASALGLALALRNGLVEVARTRASVAGKGEKMEMVYGYLTGQDFRQRIEAIVESFSTMKEELDAEQRAMQKIWAKREQQLVRTIKNTAGIYGDLQGIIGATLQPIAQLELPSDSIVFDKS